MNKESIIKFHEDRAKVLQNLISDLCKISKNPHVTSYINKEIDIQRGELEMIWDTIKYLKSNDVDVIDTWQKQALSDAQKQAVREAMESRNKKYEIVFRISGKDLIEVMNRNVGGSDEVIEL